MHKVPSVVLAFAGTLITPLVASAQAEPAPAASSSQTSPPAQPAAPAQRAPATEGEPAPSAQPGAAAPAPVNSELSAPDAEAEADDAAGELPAAPPSEPRPNADAAALAAQASTGPRAPAPTGSSATANAQAPSRVPGGIYAEDWWSHARPSMEFHGYLRTRGELFYNFSLGRVETPSHALWARPSTNRYTPLVGSEVGPQLCTRSDTDSKIRSSSGLYSCDDKTQRGANMRFRFNPELHISDNLRIKSQVDILDNVVLGSTPEGYRTTTNSGVEVVRNDLGFYDSSQASPERGINSFSNSVAVKRAWAEYSTPVGELRFGRMPLHWGLGMLYNAGDGHDDDYQSTVDRIQATVGIKPLDLFVTASWDFANEGALRRIGIEGAQAYDAGQLDDVNQYTLAVVRKKSPELTRLALARGDVVWNAGVHFMYRDQVLANDGNIIGVNGSSLSASQQDQLPNLYARRAATSYTPDVWFQLKYEKFRFELEGAAILGKIGSLETAADNQAEVTSGSSSYLLRQFGVAGELEQKLVEDRLRLRFNFGYASGDSDAYDPTMPGSLMGGPNAVQVNDRTLSQFRFNPAYRVDMILNRNILQRVSGVYYVRPGVEYDFIRDNAGQRAGGAIQAIWTRASEFIQTPGHDADLGIELNGTLYFQAKDGVLNDTPETMGGFYAAAQYGVLFPLAGMGYQAAQAAPDTSAAQMFRLYLGVIY